MVWVCLKLLLKLTEALRGSILVGNKTLTQKRTELFRAYHNNGKQR